MNGRFSRAAIARMHEGGSFKTRGAFAHVVVVLCGGNTQRHGRN